MKNLKDFTSGSVTKGLLTLALPIIFANLLQTAYQMTDIFWIGRYGTEGVAAVSICFPVIFFFLSLAIGLSMAGNILIAQYRGSRNHEAMNNVATQTVVMTILVSAAISVVGFLISKPAVAFMDVDPLVAQYAVEYLQVSFIGMVFVFGFMSMQGILRGVGEVKTPALIVLGTVLLNLIVDPLFILGYKAVPSMGVAGAAYATITTQSIAFLMVLAMLLKGTYGIQVQLKTLKPDFKLIKQIFKIGLPSSIEMSARAIGMLVLTYLIVSFGTVAVAAYGIVGQMISLVILPAVGLAIATSTIVGQNMGAQKVERAERVAIKSSSVGFVLLAAVGVALFFAGGFVASIFMPDDQMVIDQAATFMKIIALSFGFLAFHQILNGVFKGAGDTKMAMVIALIALWVVQIPGAYFASRYTSLGVNGVLVSFPISYLCATAMALFWFIKGNWREKRIIQDPGIKKPQQC